MPKTFVSTVTIVKDQCLWENPSLRYQVYFPVLPATRPAPTFEKERCSRLDKAPYVCNGCDKQISHCTIAHKYTYNARFADRKYRECLKESRSGISMTRHELHQKDRIISPLIEQGQSPYQIITNHPELELSVRSVYTYLDMGDPDRKKH